MKGNSGLLRQHPSRHLLLQASSSLHRDPLPPFLLPPQGSAKQSPTSNLFVYTSSWLWGWWHHLLCIPDALPILRLRPSSRLSLRPLGLGACRFSICRAQSQASADLPMNYTCSAAASGHAQLGCRSSQRSLARMLVPLSQLPLSFFMSLPGALLLDFLKLSLTFMPLSYCVSLRKLHRGWSR